MSLELLASMRAHCDWRRCQVQRRLEKRGLLKRSHELNFALRFDSKDDAKEVFASKAHNEIEIPFSVKRVCLKYTLVASSQGFVS